jgi:hypothetical protein
VALQVQVARGDAEGTERPGRVKLVHDRVSLFNKVTQNNRDYLLAKGYYSEAGAFLVEREHEAVAGDPQDTTATTTKGATLAGNIARSKAPADFKIVGEVLSVEPIAIMMRRDDPAFKKAVDDSIKGMISSGEINKLWDKWFMQPIPPGNTKVGLAMSESTKQALASPNDKPMEEYVVK